MRHTLLTMIALLALAVPLSGCLAEASDAPLTGPATTPLEPAPSEQKVKVGEMGWTLGPLGNLAGVTSTSVQLGQLEIPASATQITVTVTLERGASKDLQISGIPGCTKTFPIAESGVNPVLTVTCPAPESGPVDVTLRHATGHTQGTLLVTADLP